MPVVTLRGVLHAGRVGASLMTALGRQDWIAESEGDYLEIALALAADRPGKEALRQQFLTSPLTDGGSFTEVLETGYRSVWQERCAAALD